MSGIDQRVVEMKFDNATFERGVSTTLSTLDKLKHSLGLAGGTKGLEEVQKAAGRFSLSGITNSVAEAGRSFGAMQVAGVAAIATVVSRAVTAGAQIAKGLTISPITGGLREYETKLTSIQTILANTEASGATLAQVSKALNELNRYSDQTIYNFGEMARNIGTFTAAGVDLNTSVASIKGIANIAALSGSTSQQASTAMYQLSQAISAGRVSLQDWNSVVNAGMGGSVFQRALAQTAVAMGKLPEGAVKLEGAMKNVKINGESFRQSISADGGGPSWLTSDVLTTALGTFTGDMSKADLVAKGFSKSQAELIMKQAETAKRAATVVKTGTQLMGTLRESAESGWAQTWELIVGDFEEAPKLWTGVNNAIGGMIQASADARNKLLGDWKQLGGRALLIEGIKNAFQGLASIVKPIKEAFREIFPPTTAAQLVELTRSFANFTAKFKIGADTADALKRTFAGVFAIFDIAKQVISGTVGAIMDLVGAFTKGAGGGILQFTAGIGDFLVRIDKLLKSSNGVEDFFNNLEGPIHALLSPFQALASLFGKLFSAFDFSGAGKVTDSFNGLQRTLSPIEKIAHGISAVFEGLGRIFSRIGPAIGNALNGIGTAIAKAMSGDNYAATLDTLNTGLFAVIALAVKKFLSGGLTANVNVGGGLFDKVKDTLDAVTGSLQTMQQNVKANIILKIAAALGILALSIVMLAGINSADLTKSIGALAAGMAIMAVGLTQLSKSISLVGSLKLPFIAAGLVGISLALLGMATAMKIMASMSFEEIHRGIIGIAGGLTAIAIGMRLMPKGMLLQAAALDALALALNGIAVAMKIFGTMRWDEIARGLTALAGALVVIAGAMRLMPSGMVAQAAAIAILAAAMNGLGIALKLFATMNLTEIGRGLTVLAGSLVIIAGAMRLMPSGPNMVAQGAALVAIAGALTILAGALKIMASMSWGEIAKGLVTLAGAMIILAAGLNAMNGTLMGSAALLVAAGALAVLTPVLITLGSLDWGTIVKGLTALAGIFAVLGVAGLLLGPLVPVIVGLSAALVLMGAGLVLAGAGMLAMGTAFGIVVATGSAGVQVLAGILKTFITSIPAALAAFGKGIVDMAGQIGRGAVQFQSAFTALLTGALKAIITNAPLISKAFVAIVNGLLDAVIKITPKIGQAATTILQTILKVITTNAPGIGKAFLALVNTALDVLVKAVPRMADAGLKIVKGVIEAAARNIGGIVKVAGDLVVNFLNALSGQLPRIIQAGVNLIISFVNGVANAIRNNSRAMGDAGANLASAVVSGFASGLTGAIGGLASRAADMAKSALDAAKSVLGIKSPSKEFFKVGAWSGEGMANGIDSFAGIVSQTAEAVGTGAVRSIRESISGLSAAVASDMDMVPVIRPVMDLSGVRASAGQISSIVAGQSISVDAAYSSAQNASAGYTSNLDAIREIESYANGPRGDVTFVQNNTSPKALSSAELYRQTKNQLSQAREVLAP